MPFRHVLVALAVTITWGVNFVVIEIGLEGVPPLLLCALRYAVAAVPLVLLIGPPRVPWRWVVGVGLTIGVAKFGLLFIGMDVGMPAGVASLVLQAQAIFTMVFAVIVLAERPRKVQWVGAAVAAGGIVVIATGLPGGVTFAGLVLVVLAAGCWGVGNLVIKRAEAPDALRFMTWVCVVPPLPLLALSLALEGPAEVGSALAHLSLTSMAAILFIAYAATIGGWAGWGWLMRRHPASTVAPFSLVVPIAGIASGALFLGEPLTLREGVAAALVVAGVGLVVCGPQALVALRRRSSATARTVDRTLSSGSPFST